MTWDPWDPLLNAAGSLPSPPTRIACGVVSGALHVCVTTINGDLFHTIRFGPGSWQPWGDAGAQGFPGVLGIESVDCVGIGNQLHVCVRGQIAGVQPAVFRSIRIPTRWSTPAELTARYLVVSDVACGAVAGDQLHVLARCTSGSRELLIHTIRFRTGLSQALGDQDVIQLFAGTASALRQTNSVAAAGIGEQLHVIASDGTELFHTIRLNDVAWQPTFGLVRPAVGDGFAGRLDIPACANEGGNLHVCAISAGTIMHTIRISNPAAWRNPETVLTGSFGNVLAAVPSSATGSAPAATFSDIACAGE